MFRKAGKMLAVIMSAAVAVTPLAGALPVYADELVSASEENLYTDALIDEIDPVSDDIATGEMSDTEENDDEEGNGDTLSEDEEYIPEDDCFGSEEDVLTPDMDPVEKSASNTILRTEGMASPKVPTAKTDSWKGSFVYFGKYNEKFVKYRVLSPKTTTFTSSDQPTMFLDCNDTLYSSIFGDDDQWEGSTVQKSLNGSDFYSNINVFSLTERKAIVKSKAASRASNLKNETWAKTSGLYQYYTAINDYVFLLDAEDVFGHKEYGYWYSGNPFSGNVSSRYKTGGPGYMWWLRSAYGDGGDEVTYVKMLGESDHDLVSKKYPVSPALNINLASVVFSTVIAEEEGKSTEYKLTIKDRNIKSDINIDGITRKDSVISVPFSNKTDNCNRLSVVITDKNSDEEGAKLKYYAALDGVGEESSGTATFKLPAGYESTDHVYIVPEYVTDGKGTDSAGLFTEIPFYNLEEASISGIVDKPYNGKAQEQTVEVKVNGKLLEKGKDYKVFYNNNTEIGEAEMVLTGINRGLGNVTKTFKIVKGNQTITTSSASYTKNVGDKPFSLGAKSSGGGKLTYKSGDTKVVTVNDSGVVTIKGVGSTKITISAAATGKYKAASKTVDVIVKASTKKDISGANVTGITDKKYTGSKIKQSPTVKLGSKKLVRGTDYIVSYTGDRVNVGTVTVKIKGQGNYTGTVKKTFKIKRADNTLSVKGFKVNVGAKTIKEKGRTIAADKFFKVKKNNGKVTYKKKKGLAKIEVAEDGKVTIKKGVKKGPHDVKVKVTAKGDKNHKAGSKTVTITVVIK